MPHETGDSICHGAMPGDGNPSTGTSTIFDVGPDEMGHGYPKSGGNSTGDHPVPVSITADGIVSGIKPELVGQDGRMAKAPEIFPEVGFWRLYGMTIFGGDYRKRLVPIEGQYSRTQFPRHLRWMINASTVFVTGFAYMLFSTLRTPYQYLRSLDQNVLPAVVSDGSISDAKISDDRYPNITGREFVAEVKAETGSRWVMFEYNPPIKLRHGNSNNYYYVFSVSEVPATEAAEIARSRAQYHGEMASDLQRDVKALQGEGSKFAQHYKFNTVIVRLNDDVEFGEAHYLNEGDKRPSRILDNVRTNTVSNDTIDANIAYQQSQTDLWAGNATKLAGVMPTDINSFASPVLSSEQLTLRTEQMLTNRTMIGVSVIGAAMYFGMSVMVGLGARGLASRKVLEDHVRRMARKDSQRSQL